MLRFGNSKAGIFITIFGLIFSLSQQTFNAIEDHNQPSTTPPRQNRESSRNRNKKRSFACETGPISFYAGMARMLEAIAKMDAHHRLLLGFALAAVVGLSLRTHAVWTASLATYDTFAFAILGLIWVTVTLTPQDEIRAVAQRQDVGRARSFSSLLSLSRAPLFLRSHF